MNNNDLKVFERIADALESIAESLKMNRPSHPNVLNEILNDKHSLEQSFFEVIANIYVEEEKIKIEKNLKRKSSIRVSNELQNRICSFINEQVDNIEAIPHDGGYIVLKKEDTPTALFRFQTDLGFNRGEKWKDAIEHGINTADNLGISPNNVYFMVGAIKNSLDNAHIKKLLGRSDIPDNSVLLTPSYRPLLDEYLKLHVQTFTSLPKPEKQIFFLSSSDHPNDVAWEYVTRNTPFPQNIKWVQPSVTQLINELKSL